MPGNEIKFLEREFLSQHNFNLKADAQYYKTWNTIMTQIYYWWETIGLTICTKTKQI